MESVADATTTVTATSENVAGVKVWEGEAGVKVGEGGEAGVKRCCYIVCVCRGGGVNEGNFDKEDLHEGSSNSIANTLRGYDVVVMILAIQQQTIQ